MKKVVAVLLALLLFAAPLTAHAAENPADDPTPPATTAPATEPTDPEGIMPLSENPADGGEDGF